MQIEVPFEKSRLPAAAVRAERPAFRTPPRAVAAFPPTPATIIKPPRFYSNRTLIVPRAKPADQKDPDPKGDAECICERAEGLVICQKCGSEIIGRSQRTCGAHPRKLCLMDQRDCAKCRNIHLVEVPLDH